GVPRKSDPGEPDPQLWTAPASGPARVNVPDDDIPCIGSAGLDGKRGQVTTRGYRLIQQVRAGKGISGALGECPCVPDAECAVGEDREPIVPVRGKTNRVRVRGCNDQTRW